MVPTMSTLSQPHDRFFRSVFARRELTAGLLRGYLPAAFSTVFDLSTLEHRRDSYVDAALRAQQSDLLFTIRASDGGLAYVYLLLEHKSYQDRSTLLQMLGYMVNIWRSDENDKIAPRAIYPLVVYHGPQPWRAPTRFEDLFTGPDFMRDKWPVFAIQVIDLASHSDAALRQDGMLGAVMLTLKHIFDPRLLSRLPEILQLLDEVIDAPTGQDMIVTLLTYVAAGSEYVAARDIIEVVDAVYGAQGEKIMATAAREWIEQGIEQGIQRGIQQGIQQGIEQGVERGLAQGVRDSILDLVEVRFGAVPPALATEMAAIDDVERLRGLLRYAATAQSIEVLAKQLGLSV